MYECASDTGSLTQVPRVSLFSVVIYFMAGLVQSAGAFFTFLINIIVGCESMHFGLGRGVAAR